MPKKNLQQNLTQDRESDLRFPLKIARSRIAGKGAFAIQNIPAKRKLGNMGGEIISYREAQKRVKMQPDNVLFMVEFDNDPVALDASGVSNALRHINHSCDPNTYMRRAYRKVEFYTLRPIRKGEELTCDYGETHHEGTLPCKCGASNCRGFI
jgi:SET domain-containing protein